MRTYPPEVAAWLATRPGIRVHGLIWIAAREWDSPGTPAAGGLWTGDDHRTFAIGGEARLYRGAGAVLELPDLVHGIGLQVQTLALTLSPLAPEVMALLHGVNPRFARIEIHAAHFATDTDSLLAPPDRTFRGWIDSSEFVTPEDGGQGSVTLSLASATRGLTRLLQHRKSHQSQRLRDPEDDFYINTPSTDAPSPVAWGDRLHGDTRSGNKQSAAASDVADRSDWSGVGP